MRITREPHFIQKIIGGIRTLKNRLLLRHLKFSKGLTTKQFLLEFKILGVQERLKQDDIQGAKEALVEYYKEKRASGWLVAPTRLTDLRMDTSKAIERDFLESAERILNYEISPSGIKPEVLNEGDIAWTRNVCESREWLWMLNRHAWWVVLGMAYRASRDERYAEAFVSQMLDWIEKNPPQDKKNENSPTWRLMEVALRMRVSWIPCFGLFFDSPVFDNDVKYEMIKSIYDHAIFLNRYKTSMNHLLRESNGLVCVAVSFSEFKRSEHWLANGIDRIMAELPVQVYQDGVQVEISTGYQSMVIDELETTCDLIGFVNKGEPLNRLKSTLEKMYEVLMYLSRPDGTYPQLNDGFILWGKERLRVAGNSLGREDFVYVGTGGESGAEPQLLSKAFEKSGIHVMRSGWARDSHQLIFDCGPYGGFHGHEDALSIDLSVYGKPMIVDCGSYTYESKDPYRNYFVGTYSHNSVLVDGMSQVRRYKRESSVASTAQEADGIWVSGNNFDYSEGTYDGGYGSLDIMDRSAVPYETEVRHKRSILFVNREYWVVLDYLQSVMPHEYTWIYHCDPSVRAKVSTRNGLTLRHQDDSVGLRVIWDKNSAIKSDVVRGSADPIQGWYSKDHHKKEPTDTVVLRRKAKDLVMATVFMPFENSQEEEYFVKCDTDENDLCYRVQVSSPCLTDEILLNYGRGNSPQKQAYEINSIGCKRLEDGSDGIKLFSWEKPAEIG